MILNDLAWQGAVAVVGVLVVHWEHLAAYIVNAGWAGMAIAGAATIVAGSVIERYWPIIKIRFESQFTPKVGDRAEVDTQQEIVTEKQNVHMPMEGVAA